MRQRQTACGVIKASHSRDLSLPLTPSRIMCRLPKLSITSRIPRYAAAVLLCTGGISYAQVGELGPDDASRIAPGGCQIEGWYTHASGAHAWMSAPVCSAVGQPRLGANLFELTRRREGNWGIGAAAKITDSAWHVGPAKWGLKIATFTQRLADLGRMQMEHATVMGLATLRLPADLTLRLNLGPRHHVPDRETTTLLDAALAWSLDDRFSLSGEMKASDRTKTFQSLGTNLWLVPGRVGMKLNAGRTLGNDASTFYSFQLHWHLLDRKPLRR